MDEVIDDEYQALIQFLYMAPIGLMQTRIDGEILMVNPLCAQWLMPCRATVTWATCSRPLSGWHRTCAPKYTRSQTRKA
jgi:hypothetical protein